MARPGELMCPNCGRFLASTAPAEKIDTNLLTDGNSETFQCPACNQPCGPGTPVCPHCGRLFVAAIDTNDLEEGIPDTPLVRWPVSEVSVDDEQPILFDIEGYHVTIPAAPVVVIGRLPAAPTPADTRPHADLSSYGAHEKGVSRQHVKIIRKYGLVYVADLGSSNGTMLNGKMLVPHTERVMRSGDELRLGRLTMRVIFPDASAQHHHPQHLVLRT